MRLGFLTLVTATGLLAVALSQGPLVGHQNGTEAVAALERTYSDFWEWKLRNNPEFASNIGDQRYIRELEDYSSAFVENRRVWLEKFLERLENDVDRSSLPTTNHVVTYDVLKDMVQTWLDGHAWKDYGPMNPISSLDGIQTKYDSRAAQIKYETASDFRAFIARIRGYGKRADQTITRMERAIYLETTYHNISMSRVPGQFDKILAFRNNVIHFEMYEPFKDKLDEKVTNMTIRNTIREEAKSAIDYFMAQMQKLKTFIVDEYMPNTRTGEGVNVLKNGNDYYKACLKWHLSSDISPEKIHEDGKAEVQKIFKKMEAIARRQGHEGPVIDYFEVLRNRDELFLDSEEEILQRMRDILATRIRPKLEPYFESLGEETKIEPMPYDGPIGIYKNGAADGSREGVFYANVMDPTSNPTYSMAALLMHEADPGHHLQDYVSLTSTTIPAFMKSVDFSKYFAAPLHFPFYTAYIEGWAMYCEELGEEYDIYDGDFELLGKYNMEIFRAARMVVDTGIHYYGWSKEKAVQYMLDYTTFSRSALEREIDRYSTWPGQAASYTFGKLKFMELRRKIEAALGPDCFDIKQFHTQLLQYGALPLDVVDHVVSRWATDIAYSKAKAGTPCRKDVSGSNPLQKPSLALLMIVLLLVHVARK